VDAYVRSVVLIGALIVVTLELSLGHDKKSVPGRYLTQSGFFFGSVGLGESGYAGDPDEPTRGSGQVELHHLTQSVKLFLRQP